ncbi:PAS domain-containing protein [Oceanicaulis sp. LC35]|uniref:PAS domain-containing protein n=1 Tax=Oceanicaulis sp. LC35 TaxID=3349635 RepID=UPI003F85EA4D
MARDMISDARSRQLLEAISDVQAIYIGGEQSAYDSFNRLLAILLEITGSEYGFVGEVVGEGDGINPWLRSWAMTDISWDPASRALYQQSGREGVMEFVNTRLLFARILKDSRPVIANGAEGGKLDVNLPPGHPPMTAFLGLPLMSGDELLGIAGVANREGGYDPALAHFLTPLTSTIGAFIKARRLDEAAKATQARLEKSESRYALAIEGTGAGIWEWNADEETLYWSKRLLDIMGLPETYQPPTSKAGLDFMHPSDRDRYQTAIWRHLETGTPLRERLRVRHTDGRWLYVESHGQAEKVDVGAPRRMVGTLVDVSEIADAESRALKARLTAEVAVNSARMGRWWYTVGDETIFLDKRFADLLGRPDLEDKPLPLADMQALMVGEDREDVAEKLAATLDSEDGRLSVAHRVIRPDGEVLWLQVDGAIIRRDETGRPLELTGIAADQTPLRKAEQEANEHRRLYELAIKGSDLAVFDLDFKTDRLFASPGYYHMTGNPQPSGVRKISDFLEAVHPDDLSSVQKTLRDPVIEPGEPGPHKQNLVFRLRHKGGHYLWIEGVGEVLCDAEGRPERISGTLRNITEKLRIEQEARQAGLRAQMALRVAGLGVWELEAHSGVLRMDATLASILGQPGLAFEEANVERLVHFTHPEDRDEVHKLAQVLLTGEQEQLVLEHRIINSGGQTVWIKVFIRVVDRDEHDRPIRMIGIVEDLTQQKLAEDTLKGALARAEAASEAKSQFLANMSHEIRTPLNGVLGIAQLLALTDLDDRQKEFVQTIRSSGRALLSIIEDILDLSKIEVGKLKLVKRPTCPAEVIEETVQAHAPEAERKKLPLRLTVDPQLSALAMIDANRLRQVLSNLLGNAIKFTDVGEVRVEAGPTEQGMMRVSVYDTGPGLSESVQKRVFGRFEQADMSHSRSHEGSGLGLAIARELVILMGGQIGVSSRVGEGACFWFEVLAPDADPDAARETVPAALGRTTAATRRDKRVLVVDDQQVNRDVTAEMVRQGGFEPVVAASGGEALDLLQKGQFDAVLMDLHMPGMGGEEAIRRIRSGEAGESRIPVYVVSADATVETRARVKALDVEGYFSKPVELNALVNALDGLSHVQRL